MSADFLCRFLLWSLVINYVILLSWFLVFVFARGCMYKLHGRWFHLSDAGFDATHYGGMAIYKIGILLFNLAPLLALCLMGGVANSASMTHDVAGVGAMRRRRVQLRTRLGAD